MSGRYEVTLAKEDFKFSAAHFTLFDGGRGERLHGHNYRVWVRVSGEELSDRGLLVDVARLKEAVRAACRRFDSRTLIPAESPDLLWRREQGEIAVEFRGRAYRLPEEDVVLLPLINSSIELLARLLWEELAPAAGQDGASRLAVGVEETSGQACAFEADIGTTSGSAAVGQGF